MARFFDNSEKTPPGELPAAPLGGSRAQALQRLQIGIGGVVLMILLVGLASLIQGRANQIDAASVPDAAPTTEPTEASQQSDPLVEAGVVPDLPDSPTPSPTQAPPILPEEGGAIPLEE